MKKTLCLICAFALLLCGCVPTPDEEYVVNKGDNEAEKKVEATALPGEVIEQPVFPERWEDRIETGSSELYFEAALRGADMESFPVRSVRRRSFTPAEMAAAANAFFTDMTGLQKGSEPTREEIERAMELVAKSGLPEETASMQLQTLGRQLQSTKTSEAGFEDRAGFTEEDFAGASPYTYIVRGADGDCGRADDMSGSMLLTRLTYGSPQPKSLLLRPDGSLGEGYAGEKDPSFEVGFPLEEALERAEEFIKRLGAEGFTLASAEEARMLNSLTLCVVSTGYELKFVRTFGYAAADTEERDAAGNMSMKIGSVDGDEAFSYGWRYERIKLCVSETRIEYFEWTSPLEDMGEAGGNVELMDFEELSGIIKRYFAARLGDPENKTPWYYAVEEMTLSAAPAGRRDSSGAYMMPVWILKIKLLHSKADGDYTGRRMPGEQIAIDWCTVAFNAIDGTRAVIPR